MLKRTIATGIAVAVLAGAAACGADDETASVDSGLTTVPDTTTLGVPGGTLGTTPGTMPADTLGGTTLPADTNPPATP